MRASSLPLVFCIKFYQAAISPLLGGGKCRFYPTCSEYALQAVEKFGPFTGTLLAVKRLLKCGPWNEGGYDPLPDQADAAPGKWLGTLLCSRSKLRKVR